MHRGLFLSAGIVLAASASAAIAAPHRMPANIAVGTLAKPLAGQVCPVFFSPDSTALTPLARKIVVRAVRKAENGRAITLVVAEPDRLTPPSAAPLWRARIAAVEQAVLHVPVSQKEQATRLADR